MACKRFTWKMAYRSYRSSEKMKYEPMLRRICAAKEAMIFETVAAKKGCQGAKKDLHHRNCKANGSYVDRLSFQMSIPFIQIVSKTYHLSTRRDGILQQIDKLKSGPQLSRCGADKKGKLESVVSFLFWNRTHLKFNSSPLKSYLPNRKGLSSNHHFSGARC